MKHRGEQLSQGWRFAQLATAIVFSFLVGQSAFALPGNPGIYTLDADFNEGTLVNLILDPSDQLQLDDTATPFNFIWIAVSSEGTVVKIDTQTGLVMGEYHTAPQGMGKNPSRTTVDNNGSVWVANRNESGFVAEDAIESGIPPFNMNMGSAVHIGLLENGQCEDRSGNGVIETSTGLGDVLDWDSSATGADDLGGVTTADDECIIHYTRVTSTGTRHVSVDANNDVWISGIGTSVIPGRSFDLVDGNTGAIIRMEPSVGSGGYGGLIDGNGVIWSARPLLRWDTALPLTGANSTSYSHDSYGLCIDGAGNVWNTALYGNIIRKFAPDGSLLGTFPHGSNSAQGCVVDGVGDVWVAHSLIGPSSTVGHLLNDGTYIGNVAVGSGPTGVAVDAAGKVWATNYYGKTASRIDPAAGPIGAVDLTTVSLGGNLYNYSDMTGSTLIAPPDQGTWTIVHDTLIDGAVWGYVSWSEDLSGDGSILVEAASSSDGITFGPSEEVADGVGLSVADGRYLKVSVGFTRATSGESPILYDLTITANLAPDCSAAYPSEDLLWPPNHRLVAIDVMGITDPDGDPITINIEGIHQDEPTDTRGDGHFAPDGFGVGTATAEVRAERAGSKKIPGDGRVYHINYSATDPFGAACFGAVAVGVPHDRGKGSVPVDGGPLYDSTTF